MGDLAEDYAAMKAHSKEKKESNKEMSTNLLIKRGIDFEEKK